MRYLLPYLTVLFACGCARAAETPPEPVTDSPFDSIPTVWHGETVATREWTDERGQSQRLDLCKRKDGEHFFLLHACSAVCGDAGKESFCKIHCFDACFDELGRFLGFRIDGTQPFTKAKHEPFGRNDYELLDRIACDPAHVLGSLGTQTDGVDAVSGATIEYLAEQSVPGAFYTSRAVWLIAQKSVPARIQAWTLERLTADVLKDWRLKGETFKLWWFLDNAGRSPLKSEVKVEVAYELLAFTQPEVQSAALRCLQRIGATFQADRSMSSAYIKLNDTVKPEFLAWWQSQHHAPDELVTAVLDDLNARVERVSPVTVPALEYLAALNLSRDARYRQVLEELTEKSPSTFVRKKAERLLKAQH